MATSEAQKKAIANYEKNKIDKLTLRLPKGTKDIILNTGVKSVNNFIIEAINEKLEREV